MAKFTNYTQGPKGVHTKNGLVYIDAGKSADLDVSEGEAAAAKATGWFSRPKDGEVEQSPETGLKAEHHGGGKFNITKGEEVLLQGLSKADADAFNAMSDAEKAAFVAKKD